MTINPTGDQFRALAAAAAADEGPVVMLNLLKFKPQATDGGGTGRDAYRRYADALDSMVRDRGGRVRFVGDADQVVIGEDAANDWDVVLLVEYPSRAAFLDMTRSDEYQQAHAHREAGLERTVLIACSPTKGI